MRAPLAGFELGIFGCELDFAAGDSTAGIDDVDRGFGGLVMPEAPRGDRAGEVAVMTDNDRSRRLRVDVTHQCEIGSAERAARQSDFKETAAR